VASGEGVEDDPKVDKISGIPAEALIEDVVGDPEAGGLHHGHTPTPDKGLQGNANECIRDTHATGRVATLRACRISPLGTVLPEEVPDPSIGLFKIKLLRRRKGPFGGWTKASHPRRLTTSPTTPVEAFLS